MKMTFQTKYVTASVEIADDDANLYDVFETVVKPCLIGAGYHPALVEEQINEYTKNKQ